MIGCERMSDDSGKRHGDGVTRMQYAHCTMPEIVGLSCSHIIGTHRF